MAAGEVPPPEKMKISILLHREMEALTKRQAYLYQKNYGDNWLLTCDRVHEKTRKYRFYIS